MTVDNTRRANQYRELRVTLQEQTGGRFTVNVWVKPRGAAWHFRHRVAARTFRMSDPPGTLPGILRLMADEFESAVADLET